MAGDPTFWENALQGWVGAAIGGGVTALGVRAALRHERSEADIGRMHDAVIAELKLVDVMEQAIALRDRAAYFTALSRVMRQDLAVQAIASGVSPEFQELLEEKSAMPDVPPGLSEDAWWEMRNEHAISTAAALMVWLGDPGRHVVRPHTTRTRVWRALDRWDRPR